ncbi:carotenoid oxygenase family protein [Leptolyngbya sp. FACHB-541]|uniref:carotenoid oxygenase family protein n=1 Tax=Leptolyngbya sp. FACHB-541 TaxID=2692810 RepID=UPI0016897D37|nr:carotenoid oxygenase family protein [Leptolyngbya sp. FACHB-541]MBD1995620.1 carotenoid oxygenase family protein [Leptolyngbya sp. FACHB-541]
MQSFQLHEHATSVPVNSYQLEEWQKGYESLREEFDYWIDQVEGEIPPDLEGTLFRNGPGLLDVGGQPLQHPFDGDGMISAIAFSQGKAHFRNRFIRTEGFLAEQKAQKILYRGVFGTQKPGGWLANAFDFRLKNIANTQVIYWGGKLLALWEAAEPHRLDPHTLETIGIDHLDGVLKPGSAFAAHPCIDPSCAEDGGAPCLVNFSIKPGLSTTITIFELDEQCKVIRQHAHAVPGFAFIHDFAITPNYCIFFQNPVHFNPVPFVVGLRGPGECIQFQGDRPTQIIVIPRHGSAPVQTLSTQSGFVFHHANAFEQDGYLYVDSVCYGALPSVEPNADYRQVKFEELEPGQLWRFRLDLKANTVERQSIESRCCEFPFVHPNRVGRPYRYVYLGAAHAAEGNAPLQAILKIDMVSGKRQVWSAAPHGYVGEPIFVPRPPATAATEQFEANGKALDDEDRGWVLTLVYDAKMERSELVILDAKDLTKEPVARLQLKHHIPYGLHGSFTSTCFL